MRGFFILPRIQCDFKCWVCRERDAGHRHHVIQLQNGGAVSSARNVVLICPECHSDIHPWLNLSSTKPKIREEFDLAQCTKDVSILLNDAARGRLDSLEIAEKQILKKLRSIFNSLAKSTIKK